MVFDLCKETAPASGARDSGTVLCAADCAGFGPALGERNVRLVTYQTYSILRCGTLAFSLVACFESASGLFRPVPKFPALFVHGQFVPEALFCVHKCTDTRVSDLPAGHAGGGKAPKAGMNGISRKAVHRRPDLNPSVLTRNIPTRGNWYAPGAMHNLEDRIALANRRVNESRLIEQRKLILEGRAVPNAAQLLKTFEESLEILESNLRHLLGERDKQ
jgi:hypothetical protein